MNRGKYSRLPTCDSSLRLSAAIRNASHYLGQGRSRGERCMAVSPRTKDGKLSMPASRSERSCVGCCGCESTTSLLEDL